MKRVLIAGLLIMFLVTGTAQAQNGNFPTEQELATSCWKTVYVVKGQNVDVTIEFNGTTGVYYDQRGNRVGVLKNVQYGVVLNPAPGVDSFFQINADWKSGNQSGSVVFSSKGPNAFTGKYIGNGGGGDWNGTRK